MTEDDNLINNPNLSGDGCFLSAHGRSFEPADFLRETLLPAAAIVAYGRLGFPAQFVERLVEKEVREAAALLDSKILVLKLSAARLRTAQFADATAFLRRYREEISRLSRFSGVEQLNLRCVAAAGEDFSANCPDELMILAGECGLTSLMC